jgi:enoyl-[acyl-carrier protein] reductase III
MIDPFPMEVSMLLEGKIALVTGSGRGIGRAIALRLAQEGADIIVNFFRNREPAEKTLNEIKALGRRALVVKANVGTLEGIDDLFQQTQQEMGGLDILVCNAASGYNRPIMEQKQKAWDWTMNINARAVLFCAQRAAPMMEARGGGSIINISSPGSSRVLPDYALVGTSKAALESLTRYLAVEFSSMGIVVNSVSPGVVRTEALRMFGVEDDSPIYEEVIEFTPAKRLVTGDDVGGLIAFLCTPAAEMIRGQNIIIDGGATLPVGANIDLSEIQDREK